MKKILSFCTCLAVSLTLNAQLINFDNYVSATNNDLTNYFSGSHNLIQVTDSGITGGAVKAPQFSMGQAVYAKFQVAQPITVSICFKYSSGLAQWGFNDEAATIEFINPTGAGSVRVSAYGDRIKLMRPANDFTHFISNGGTLTDGHWYKLEVSLNAASGSAYIYDLGADGTSTPTVRISIVGFSPQVFTVSSLARIEWTGSERGGASFLDNFFAQGQFPLSVSSAQAAGKFKMPTLITTELPVNCTDDNPVQYTIYSTNGSMIRKGVFTSHITIAMNDAPAGYYLIMLSQNDKKYSSKILKQ